MRKDDVLTSAFRSSSTASRTSRTIAKHLLNEVRSANIDTRKRTAWTMFREFDKRLAAVWLLVVLMMSILAGTSAGFGTGDANLGFNVGAGVLSVFSTMQAILILWQTQV